MGEQTEGLKIKLTKKLLAGTLAAMTLLGSLAGYLLNELKKPVNVNVNPTSVTLQGAGTEVTECFGVGGAATTTGLTRIMSDDGTTKTATTTLVRTCSIDRATDLAFNYILGATTTVDVDFTFQFSHDGGTWFNEVTQTAESNQLTTIGTGSSTPRRYRHNFNGTTTKQLPLVASASRYARVLVQTSGTQGSTSVWIWSSISKREGLSR